MKVIRINEKCEIKAGETTTQEFDKNEFYIMSDQLSAKLKLLLGEVIGPEIPFKEIYNKYEGQDLKNRRILFMRHGGGGDILFMTTAIKELKKRNPDAIIGVAIGEAYRGIVEQNPYIDEINTLPISLKDWSQYHYHMMFENVIEENPLAREYNAYDLFLIKTGFNPKEVPAENKIPEIFISEIEKRNMKNSLPSLSSSSKKIGVQVEASSPIRKYPLYGLITPLKILIEEGYLIYLFGGQGQLSTINYLMGILGDSTYQVILPLRQSLVAASFMDYFLAPDSLFIHVAGAMRIPLIGLYGPFHSDLRMKYFKNAIGINAKTACSPCFRHGHYPCPKGDPSPCFSVINSDVILKAFSMLVEKIENKKILGGKYDNYGKAQSQLSDSSV